MFRVAPNAVLEPSVIVFVPAACMIPIAVDDVLKI
jgi:hypothetical protein